jgi:peptide deformylase
MILPIVAYGHPILKKEGIAINETHPDLNKLVDDMWDTMYNAKGVGLAAHQVGLTIKLFLVDTIQIKEEDQEGEGIKQAFINLEILSEEGEEWAYEEGCLSIPNINGDVYRKPIIHVRYQDTAFKTYEATFSGMEARVIQHEHDHTQGILFTDKINPLKRRLVSKKLDNIRKGKATAAYRMKYA